MKQEMRALKYDDICQERERQKRQADRKKEKIFSKHQNMAEKMAEAKKTQNSVIQERIYSTVRSQIVKSELAGAANQWEHVDHSPKL